MSSGKRIFKPKISKRASVSSKSYVKLALSILSDATYGSNLLYDKSKIPGEDILSACLSLETNLVRFMNSLKAAIVDTSTVYRSNISQQLELLQKGITVTIAKCSIILCRQHFQILN